MTIEDTMSRMDLLGSRINEATATKLEIIEWFELTNNGNHIKGAAIQLLKKWATTDYGDGYFDGFVEAKNLYEKDIDISNYTKKNIIELSAVAESNFDSQNNQNG
ncbi:hypothetical protein [Vibrio anguillarum]|uniref:Uncharacterized protein n=1 Tax=Vibrio anguillarum TaxID=55601 RepID=A0AAW4BJH6_VIBAN|nr:hypothetical protein [Vibrio anguillarum]MBF4374403.1 hypothetical protein [Vibrio anguillarum]MBF4438185.1 hypothetical protein [Vibrio anguillarum]